MAAKEFFLFGNRCPKGWKKKNLIGQGRISAVWLCCKQGNEDYDVAIKQFPKREQNEGSHPSSKREILF